MPLQIRRGTTTDRLTITPVIGELIYDTTANSLYIGNGETIGGVGLTAAINSDLNLGSFSIVSSSNGDIRISPNGTGKVVISKDISIAGNISKTGLLNITASGAIIVGDSTNNIPGNLLITRNVYSTNYGAGLTFSQHHETADAVPITFYRTRGTSNTPTATVSGDSLGELIFYGHDGSTIAGGATITAQANGNVVSGHVPTRLLFATDNGTSFTYRAELSANGELFVNRLSGFSERLSIRGELDGDVTGSVFSDNSTRIIDGTSGSITAPSVTASSYIKFAVYANPSARDVALPTGVVEAGMVVFLTDSTGSGGSPKLQVNTDSTTSGWVDL